MLTPKIHAVWRYTKNNTGQGYASDTLEYIALASNTRFAPAPALFVELLLDGMQWMTAGKYWYWDWSVKGRDLGGDARPILFDTSTFTALPQQRRAELAAFAARIDAGDAGAGSVLTGHRSYWCSDYAVVHSTSPYTEEPWMASVHMHSNRTVSARCKCLARQYRSRIVRCALFLKRYFVDSLIVE